MAQEQQINAERGRGLRSTILTQQDDVKSLADEVQQMQADFERIRKLSDQVRQLLSLPQATPLPPTATPAPKSLLRTGVPASGQALGLPRSDGLAFAGGGLSLSRGGAPPAAMLLALESSQTLEAMRPLLPWAEKELQYLGTQTLFRLSKIDPSQRATQSALEAQLKLLAAAPTRWPVVGRITSDFGWRPALFNPAVRELHTGIDIAVWYFTPVRATKAGVVTRSGWMEGYGNTVEITHDMGYSTLYGHNYDLKVTVGQRVKAGDVIARSGQTGYASGPHVHYEVRLNGQSLEPVRFLDLAP
ncbi:MAG: M23 family metallopeptidase [Chloroflexi bacterium]|nr:M23 family metallopeptidase [Chloroflexota bacterium]